ncbi:DNA-processing protein DprA [Candidatus Arthromitus sp. SFB-rat-Yit]|uniref:DNA-processing protein DprA n=1 Tax=Candidatus Arthromitus sp. SFB-rat-Yit TaxID=1041504 RepID=UPI000227A770|nr:DNA-processing protein DprA [Candidatus Arthromitus sp. SFB-rat-Yit]BAK81160.1 DNA protecting protein DprA [Candidatus Arthromitus sp. SFB-rat-Yit]
MSVNFYDYWILKTNVSSNIKIKLMEDFKISEEIYKELIERGNLNYLNLNEYDKFVKTYKELKDDFDVNKYNALLEKNNIKFVKFGDDEYPDKFKNIDNKPFSIFYKGNINLLNNYSISIIGTRNATPYGEEVCKKISRELSLNNVGVVSGGARGIDILSHKICLENNGIPICVLGSGLLNYYPKENFHYFNEIGQNGCILSEYDVYTNPDKFNFPQRNRIISAIGDGLIVIEAKEKSGTMITVKYALDYGKDIAAVPGPIFWDKSMGCNKLIRDGASIISEIKDLYDIFKLNRNTNNIVGRNYEELLSDPSKYKVFSLIKNRPSNVDEIANETGINVVDIYKILFELESLNIIEASTGNFYQLKAI